MTASNFEEGDEVQHKTGGPRMIFTGTSQGGEAICEWFNGVGRQQDTFAFSALKKCEQSKIRTFSIGRA